MEHLQLIHPDTISEYDDGSGPVCWILCIPTTLQLMNQFINKEITLWSDENVRNLNPNMVQEDYHHVRKNKQEFLAEVKGAYLRSIDFLSKPLREENTP
jgi:hypothetical protein